MAQSLPAHLPLYVYTSSEDATWLQHTPYKFSSDSDTGEADTALNHAYLRAVQALRQVAYQILRWQCSVHCVNRSAMLQGLNYPALAALQDWQEPRRLQQVQHVFKASTTHAM